MNTCLYICVMQCAPPPTLPRTKCKSSQVNNIYKHSMNDEMAALLTWLNLRIMCTIFNHFCQYNSFDVW